MFKLCEKYEIIRNNLKWDYIKFSPSEIRTINTTISQTYINIPKEESVNTVLGSYLESNFEVLHASTSNRFVDGDDIRLVNLGPTALFSFYKLTSGLGEHIKEIWHAHVACLTYKFLSIATRCDDLSISFYCDRGRRQRKLTNNKNQKGKHHITKYLKDIFGFAEHQEKTTHGLSYRLTLTRYVDSAVLKKDNTVKNAKLKTNCAEWFASLFTRSISKQAM